MTNPFVDEKTARIANFILEKEGTYLSEIERELEYSRSTILNRLEKLIEGGYLKENWVRIKAAEAKTWIKRITVVEGKEEEILRFIS